jgi:hypothetical protein
MKARFLKNLFNNRKIVLGTMTFAIGSSFLGLNNVYMKDHNIFINKRTPSENF